MRSNRNSQSLLVGMQNGTVTLEDILVVSYKTKHILTIDPAIMFLSIYPKELETYVHTKTCTWMLMAALNITAKTWKQPRRSSGEWIKQTVAYSENGVLFGAKKKCWAYTPRKPELKETRVPQCSSQDSL